MTDTETIRLREIGSLRHGEFNQVVDIQGMPHVGFVVGLNAKYRQPGISPPADPASGTRGYPVGFYHLESYKCDSFLNLENQSNHPLDENPCNCPQNAAPHQHCGICHGYRQE